MKTQIEWIPVSEQLPPDDQSAPQFYLTANEGGFVRCSGWRPWTKQFLIRDTPLRTVTHWSHLPKHPAQLEDEG